MSPKLIQNLREALQDTAGKPVEIEDAQTHEVCVLMTRSEFRRLIYDDTDLTSDEMRAAAALGLSDAQGWNAPGMEPMTQRSTILRHDGQTGQHRHP
jgi:hypothetical protein